jgi:hypothetical protein
LRGAEMSNKYTIGVTDYGQAFDLINEVRALIIVYGAFSVADVIELIGGVPAPGDEDRGWVNIPSSSPYMGEDGLVKIDFSMPVPLGPKARHKETVNHPDHYQSETGLEAWDVIRAFTFDLKGIEAFDTGNILKYICRWKRKNGLEDLKKAARYLEHLIDHVENLEKEND